MHPIRINLNSVATGNQQVITATYGEATTLATLLDDIGQPCAEISLRMYYSIGHECCNGRILPYVVSRGHVEWFPLYDTVRVSDFLATHRVQEAVLEFNIEFPQAGGPDIWEIIQMWNFYYPYLEQTATVFGFASPFVWAGKWLYGKIFKSTPKWLNQQFKENTPPSALVDFITSKDSWNHFDLGKILDISPEEAKNLLRGLGYRWANQTQLYNITYRTAKLIKKLSKITWYKHG